MEYGAGSFQWSEQSYNFKSYFCSQHATHLQVGLPQWGSPEWKGTFYKDSTSPKNFLSAYGQRLTCVEVSSTYYSEVSTDRLSQWAQSVPDNFRFLPKWPQIMTHQKLLQCSKDEIQHFAQSLKAFGEKLGTSFIQLPPQFSTQYKRELFYFLEAIPKDVATAIEFRHSSWFENQRVFKDLEKYLADNNFGMVISDTPTKQEVFHLSFTGSQNIIRFLSDDDSKNDQKRLKYWSQFFNDNNQLGSIYFCLHKVDNSKTPELIALISPESAQQIEALNSDKQQSLL